MTIDLINNVLIAPLYWAVFSLSVLVLVGRSRNTSAQTLHALLLFTLVGVLLIPLSRWLLPVVQWPILPQFTREFLQFSIFPHREQFATLMLVIWAYSLGVLLLWMKILGQIISAYTLTLGATTLNNSEHQQMLKVLSRKLGVTRRVHLRYSPQISSPLTLGYFEPYILLPLDSSSWTQEMMRDFLLHELAHIRRSDWLTLTLAKIITAVFWILPTVWLLLEKLSWFAELACDDCVVQEQQNRAGYAQHLLLMSKRIQGVAGAVHLIELSNHYQRIAAVLDGTRVRNPHNVLQYTYVFVLSALLAIGCCIKLTVSEEKVLSNSKLLQFLTTPLNLQAESNFKEVDNGRIGVPTTAEHFQAEEQLLPLAVDLPSSEIIIAPSVELEPVEIANNKIVLQSQVIDLPEVKVRKSVVPPYPASALKRQKEGKVLVVFDVLEDGSVSAARVLESSNIATLDRAALDAIKQYQYYPPLVEGQPTSVSNVTEFFHFQIQEDAKH